MKKNNFIISLVGLILFSLSVNSQGLFFSEYAEGSASNKYLEIYNASDVTVDLTMYALANSSNGSDGTYEFWNTFPDGATIAPGSVYVIAHGYADDLIQSYSNYNFNYLSNGDDGFALVAGTEDNFEVIDLIGDWNEDPGSGWSVAGIDNATRDHTLVRKCGIIDGNSDWQLSAGTNEEDSEWVVLDQNDWTNLGFHTLICPGEEVFGCTDPNALNFVEGANVNDGSCSYPTPPCILGVVYISESHGSGSPEDYIEIYNSGDTDCSMAGFLLDDSPSFEDLTFGDVVIPAGGYWLGWEDYEESFTSGISSGGEVLYLSDGTVNEDGTFANVITVELFETIGLSQSFDADGLQCHTQPSPGEPNTECVIFGCTDQLATNFDSTATFTDGSCVYAETVSCVLGVVYVSEVNGDYIDGDYIEIYNSGSVDCSLEGFMIDDSPSLIDLTFGDVMVPAGGYWLGFEDAPGSFGSGIGSSGDYVFFGDSNGNVLEVYANYSYGLGYSNSFDAGGNSCFTISSPGSANTECVPVGCMDTSACNFDSNATVESGDCNYAQENFDCEGNCLLNIDCNGECGGTAVIDLCGVCDGGGSSCTSQPLFFSEYAEGSSNNKYLEIFNPTNQTVDLSLYAFPNVANEPSELGSYEYWNNFPEGSSIAPGDVFIIAHPSSDEAISNESDMTYYYLSNGDDGFALVFGNESNYEILDWIGDWNGDPGSGWSVAGLLDATQNHTLVRKCGITTGNTDWLASAGTNAEDSEWIVLDQNDFSNIGSYCDFIPGCTDSTALNYNEIANIDDESCEFPIPCVLGTVYISEAHGSGTPADYIEIFNSGDTDCTLAGFLLDDGATLSDLTFGDVVVESGGYWIGYEDYDGSFTSGISASGETLYFSDGTDVLSVDLGPSTSLSYSFDASGSFCLTVPSPGEENNDCAILGCNDVNALNYDVSATYNDGSCEYSVTTPCVLGTVYVSEAHGSYYQGDYIEIYNSGTEDCSLAGFMLDDSESLTDLTFTDVMIPAGGYWLGFEDATGSFGSGIGSSGDYIYFSDGSNVIQVTVLSGDLGATNFTADGTACSAEPTPGAVNAECTVFVEGCTDQAASNYNSDATLDDGTCEYVVTVASCVLGTVYVTEAHGSGDPEDYIEIYNSGAEDCSLLGFMLDDSESLTDLTFGDVVIPAGGYWLGYKDAEGSFGSGIGGSGDTVYLGDADGNVLMVETLDGDLGATNFTADGTACSAEPTPGAANAECTVFVEGCTDQAASNYNSDATLDDGTCEYVVTVASCVLGTVYVTEAHGSGDPEDYIEIYNSGAEDCSLAGFMLDDEMPFGDLTFGDVVIPAGGYWLGYKDAEGSFGSGIGGSGDTVYLGDADGNVLMVETLDGDLGATNFTADGTACSAEPTPGAVNAECIVLGCTDESASNYNSDATLDDGTCEYLGCTDLVALNYNQLAITDDGTCEYGPWGPVQFTDCNMTVLVQADANIIVEGELTTSEILIGAFTEEGILAGQAIVNPGVVSSIALWGAEAGENNGFQAGEEITWLVYYNGEEIPANIELSFGESTYSCNGLSGINVITATSVFTQEINLLQGWSLWSTYISPADGNMESVFTNIVDDLTIVKDEGGNVYWPLFELNSIGDLTIGEGYQAKMSSSSTLVVEGELVPHDTQFNLNSGWNMMGYLHQEAYSVESMMSTMTSTNLVIMKDSWGNVYWPQFGLNNIGNMNPGQGYQIKLTGSWNFSYPTSGGARYGDVYTERPVHFEEPSNTGNNMIIGLPLNAWESTPSIGDEIAAYGEDGELIGSTTFQGDHIALTVWGDDLTTDKKDGITEGESISFKLWNSQTGVEQALEVRWSEGVGFYTTDGISIAGQIILGSELATNKQLVRITDMLGRDVNGDEKDVMLLYIYDDGSIERVYIKE